MLQLLSGCKPSSTPPGVYVEAGAEAVDKACSFLEGVTSNKTAIAICATAEEVSYLVSTFVPLLGRQAEAGATCTTLPSSSVCLTPRQMGDAIQSVIARRRARLTLDAGALQ